MKSCVYSVTKEHQAVVCNRILQAVTACKKRSVDLLGFIGKMVTFQEMDSSNVW